MAVYKFVTQTGIIIVDTEQVSDDVIQEYLDTFGQDLITTSDTRQGVLIVSDTTARQSVTRETATVANQFNPNLSGGIYLDALLALTGGARVPQTFSQATVDMTGVDTTFVPAGTLIKDSQGNEFSSMVDATLTTGTVSVLFQAVEPGAISASANTLTQIVNGVQGLETVNNPLPSSVGRLTQSDIAARQERRIKLGQQGTALYIAIRAALANVPGVSPYFTLRENVEPITQVIDDITLVAKSIYLCIFGGADFDVASVLLAKKTMGCAWNNGASSFPKDIPVTDPNSGQVYQVLFDRPDIVDIAIQVTVAPSSVEDPVTNIKNAIMDYVNGLLDGEAGFVIGKNVSAFELAGAINVQFPQIFVRKVETKKLPGGTFSTNEIIIKLWELPATTRSSINVLFS